MGTEFSRRVNAWIAVSGATRDSLLAPIAQCRKLRRREGLERMDGKMQRRSGVGTQSRKIAIKIRTTRHKKHGNGRQTAGRTPAAVSPRRPIK